MLGVIWYGLVLLAVFHSYRGRSDRSMYYTITALVLWSAAAFGAPGLDYMGYDDAGAAVVNTYSGAWYLMYLCFGFAGFELMEVYTLVLSPEAASDETLTRYGFRIK